VCLVAELELDTVVVLEGQHLAVDPFAAHGQRAFLQTRVDPFRNVVDAPDLAAVLHQEHDLDAHLLRLSHLVFEAAAVTLCCLPGVGEVVGHLRQVLLAVHHQARVVQVHVVALIQLAGVVLHAAPVESVQDPLDDVGLFPGINLYYHIYHLFEI